MFKNPQTKNASFSYRAGEVPSGSNANAASMIRREYSERVTEEYSRLTASLPIFKGI